MGWESMKRESGGSENYVKLKDGESIEGVFVGEPHTFYSVFKDRNEYDSWAEGRSFKFKINFVVKNPDTGNYEAKIFQQGSRAATDLESAREEYGLKCVYKIKRTGSTKEDTRYSILFKKELTQAQMDAINAVPLLPLKKENGVENAKSVLGAEEEIDFP